MYCLLPYTRLMCLHASINNTYQHKKGPFKYLFGKIYLYCTLYLIEAQKITILCALRKGNPPKYEFGRFEMTPEFQTKQTYHVIGNPRELANGESGFPADMIECLLTRQGFVNKE